MIYRFATVGKVIGVFATLLLPSCGYDLASQTYRVEGGRTVGEWFSRGQTGWKVSGEYRFERRGK